MFDREFYPTPENVAHRMLENYNVTGKKVLEPSAGKGDLVKVLQALGAEVIACEKHQELRVLTERLCTVIASDFFTVKSEQVSHLDFIVMNPPFSNADRHILHAWEIAPAGCKILALCNLETVKRKSSYSYREQLGNLIEQYGHFMDFGDCFSSAERKTEIDIAFICLEKPGANYEAEFEGFFMEEEPEEQGNGIIKYDAIRDLVNRYIAAIKLFDSQLDFAVKLHEMTAPFCKKPSGYYNKDDQGTGGLFVSEENKQSKRNQFKKGLQKEAWLHVFGLMNMEKFATRGLKEDINKFVEQNTEIPFSMRNIYKMLEIVIGTQEQRMDRALLEVFDKVTKHSAENQYHVEGWKTNSHYLLTEKFIIPHVFGTDFGGGVETNHNGWEEPVNDMIKALCHFTGMDYDDILYPTLYSFCREIKMEWGQWHCWGFFEVRAYKKGTAHFKFQDKELWGRFNQRIAKLKGYPLYEHKEQTVYQKKQTGHKEPDMAHSPVEKAKVIFEFEI